MSESKRRYIVAILANHSIGLEPDGFSFNRLGITDEAFDTDDIIWCSFDWGYGA